MKKLYNIATTVMASEGMHQSFINVVGNVLATGISAVAMIILSRLLGPTGFGEFSVGFAIVMILIRLNDLGLNASLQKYIPITESHKHKNNLINFTLSAKFIIFVCITVIGLICSNWLTHTLSIRSPYLIPLSFITSFIIVLYEEVIVILQSVHLFIESVVMNAVQAVTKLVMIGVFFYLNIKAVIPIYTLYMSAPIVSLLIAQRLLPNWFAFKPSTEYKKELSIVKGMATHSALGFIAAGLIENIDVILVQGYLSSFETGLLSGLTKIAMMVMLVGYSLGSVLYPRVARYKDKDTLKKYIKKAWMVLGVCIVGCLILLPFSGLLIQLTIGSEYLQGTWLLALLIIASFITIAAIPFQALFYTLDAEWYFSVSGILQLLIVVAGNVWLLPHFGLEATIWTRVASRMFLLLFSVFLGLYYFDKHYGKKASPSVT